jgi:LysR family transcriptional regulator, hydrogen peroxide-inducible genes activator
MEIHQLRYFVAVADEGNFSRAADKVHVSQPSLSQQIQKLEDEVGQPLFDRLPRSVVLTEAGKRFLGSARRMLATLADAQRCVDECKGEAVGKLVIGAIPTIAPFVLPRLLPNFRRAHPKVTIEVVEDVTENLTRGVEDGELDLALLSNCQSSDFQLDSVGEEPLLVATPAGHRLSKRQCVTWEDLKGERFLALHHVHCLSRRVDQLCQAHGLQPEFSVRGSQLNTILGMVNVGLGITLVPQMLVTEQKMKGCTFLSFAAPAPTRELNLIRNPQRFQSKAALLFSGMVASTLSGQAGIGRA